MFSRLVTQWLVMRGRSSRRKSPWNLLLAPAIVAWFFALCYAFLFGMRRLNTAVNPDLPRDLPLFSPSEALTLVGAVVAGMLPAFLMANLTVWLIPAARRAMDREAQDHPGTTLRESNLGLLRASMFTVPLGLMLAIAGMLLA